MIRYTLLALVVTFLCVYAWRDWFKALCGLIMLMAVVENPEMPKTMFGIPGLNPWNLVLLMVCMSWWVNRRAEDLRFDMPPIFRNLLILYVIIFFIGFYRAFVDRDGIAELALTYGGTPLSQMDMINNNLINTVKWAIPGMLLFTGARTRERQFMGMLAIIFVCVFLGLLTIRWMPLSLLADGEALSDRALRLLDGQVGYHRVDLAAMMAGGFWAALFMRSVVTSHTLRVGLLIAAGITLLALALTGGRTGYGAWAALGVMFALMRSKKYIFMLPVIALIVLAIVPAARDRLMFGFQEDEAAIVPQEKLDQMADLPVEYAGLNLHAITSGRSIAWPFVMEKIAEKPWVGHGQLAMVREGITLHVAQTFGTGEMFPHPHNAYLELLLDNGILGALPILLFFLLLIKRGLRTLRDRTRPFESTVAAVSLAFIGAQLLASIGSQSFYPASGTVLMWCAIGLQLRLLVQHDSEAREAEPAAEIPLKRRRAPALGAPTNARYRVRGL